MNFKNNKDWLTVLFLLYQHGRAPFLNIVETKVKNRNLKKDVSTNYTYETEDNNLLCTVRRFLRCFVLVVGLRYVILSLDIDSCITFTPLR